MVSPSNRKHWIVAAGRWLTKRRGILLTPLFALALLAARRAPSLRAEILQDAAGLLCLLGGSWLRLVAASYHESSHHLEPITAGPYAWVRHPLYLANFLIGIGIMLFAGWRPMIAAYALAFFPLHWLIARSEELHLTALYGEKYDAYRRSVPALLPWRLFPGPRYGVRNEFKLRKGRERMKVAGYLAGMSAVLAFKQIRGILRPPSVHPIPLLGWAGGALLVLLLVVFRPITRSSRLRACQTALSTATILLLALHVPGVWPARPTVQPVHAAARPRPISPKAAAISETRLEPIRRAPDGRPSDIPARIWDHLEILGGVSAFGVATLIEREREGGNFVAPHELNEAGRSALLAAWILSLWKAWHPSSPRTFADAPEGRWRFQVSPAIRDSRAALVATFRKRF